MFGIIVTLAAGGIVVLSAVAAVFVIGMRRKSHLVQGAVVWFNRRFMNPRQLLVAGKPGAYASIVRHRGRHSGSAYETPVGVVPDGDGFLIALPYGPRTQWLRNVLAAGEAVLVTEGRTIAVDRPEVIPTEEVADRFSSTDQRSFRIFATNDCLRLHRAVAIEATIEPVRPVAA
jgi:deazaflavin-dependent oxidoreductase (nitroreductase family)